MKLAKEIIIKDAKSISKIIDQIIYEAEMKDSYDEEITTLKSSLKTLSGLLKETE